MRATNSSSSGSPSFRRTTTNLNHHSDEISCGVGLASLSRLHETIVRRLSFVTSLTARLLDEETVCQPYGYSPGDSPFVYPIIVDVDRITCPKIEFARAVRVWLEKTAG